ncbi:MAG: hypothetical protein JOZ41_18475 [Chloroflexi bacterium]|nr:hypothetical protein [Chloroflexota bacterium]
MIGRPITPGALQFSERELTTLQSLRARYQSAHPLFTDRELARLRFLRWLVQSPDWKRAMDQPYQARTGPMTAPQRSLWTPAFGA